MGLKQRKYINNSHLVSSALSKNGTLRYVAEIGFGLNDYSVYL